MSNYRSLCLLLVVSIALIIGISFLAIDRPGRKSSKLSDAHSSTVSIHQEPSSIKISPRQEVINHRNSRFAHKIDTATNRAPKFHFSIGEQNRKQLRAITGLSVWANAVINPEMDSFTIEEVIEMYPFLTTESGAINVEAAQELLANINKLVQKQKEIWADVNRKRDLGQHVPPDDPLFQSLQHAIAEWQSQLMGTAVRFDKMPSQILPTDELLALSPTFSHYSVIQMRSFLQAVSLAQTYNDNGQPQDRIHKLLQSAIAGRYGYNLSDEAADKLLNTDLSKLAIGVFEPKE